MGNLNIINIYNDDNLSFNKTTNRYELTPEYCRNEFGSNYGDDKILAKRISLNSRVVYNYILTHIALVNRPVVMFFLHRTEEGRQFLIEILAAQMYADIETGYNDVGYQPAVNFNGQDKDRSVIHLNTLCVAAEEIFYATDQYFGIRLGYQGQFPYQYFMLARSYETK